MNDYTALVKSEKYISVCFYITQPNIMAIGEKMEAVCPEAYMNGYNWEAFFNYYLKQHAPDLLEGMNTDPEADMYAAFYPLTEENEAKAHKFVEMIRSLVEHEEELCRIVEEEGSEIEWD